MGLTKMDDRNKRGMFFPHAPVWQGENFEFVARLLTKKHLHTTQKTPKGYVPFNSMATLFTLRIYMPTINSYVTRIIFYATVPAKGQTLCCEHAGNLKWYSMEDIRKLEHPDLWGVEVQMMAEVLVRNQKKGFIKEQVVALM